MKSELRVQLQSVAKCLCSTYFFVISAKTKIKAVRTIAVSFVFFCKGRGQEVHFLVIARYSEDFSGCLEVSGTLLTVIVEPQHISALLMP